MDTPTSRTALRLTLLVLILAITVSFVSADLCTTAGLQRGEGAAISNKATFGCKNIYCLYESPGYNIILHGNNDTQRWQEVTLYLQKGCDRSSVRYNHTFLILVSGSPVTWVLTGFTPGIVFMVGEGNVRNFIPSDDVQFKLYNMPPITDTLNLSRNIEISGFLVKQKIDALQENYFEVFGRSRWPYSHQVAASVNYAWMATSWTLTTGEDCCVTVKTTTKSTTAKTTTQSTTETPSSTALPAINGSPLRTISVTNTSVTIEFPASFPRADEYLVEYGVYYGRYTRGVTVPDTNKDRYTVTQGQLRPGYRHHLRVVPYTAGRRGGASDPVFVTTLTFPRITTRPLLINLTDMSVMIQFPASSDAIADEYVVEYAVGYHHSHGQYTRGVNVSDTKKRRYTYRVKRYTVTQGQLTPGTPYRLRVVPYTAGRRGGESEILYFTTRSIIKSSSSALESWLAASASGAAILVFIICCCCCCFCKGKQARTTPQTSQPNALQSLQTIEPGTTAHSSSRVGVNYFGAVPQPTVGPAGLPEQPPSYDDAQSIPPPRYSQVMGENRVEPSAPPMHI